jgi:hypothetical protein
VTPTSTHSSVTAAMPSWAALTPGLTRQDTKTLAVLPEPLDASQRIAGLSIAGF